MLKEITDRSLWNALAHRSERSVFLQSWEWGEFQKQVGRDVLRLGLLEDDELVAGMQCIRQPMPLSFSYWYAPYGPLVAQARDHGRKILQLLKEAGKRKDFSDAVFFRFEPRISRSDSEMIRALETPMPVRRTHFVQPKDTRVLDLSRTENELLEAMHQKTRYNIRLAEKKGVNVLTGKQYVKDFIALNKETTTRDGFKSHADSHYEKLVSYLPDSMIKVYAAEYKGKVIAANLVIVFGDTVTYLHGASASADRNVMAPHLLQWRQIHDAKNSGAHYYDFWGIAPSSGDDKHSDAWQGITRFKNGFGGIELNYCGAYDLPIKKFWYSVYRRVQTFRML